MLSTSDYPRSRTRWTVIYITVPLAIVLLTITAAWARERSVFDRLALLADVRHQLVTYYVDEPDEEKLIESAVRAMVDSLDDPHTNFLTLEELKPLQRTVSGKFTGIGAEVDINEAEDRLRIITPLEDSPAWESGVMAGDIVLSIDGEDTQGMSLYECVDKLTGPAGTQVTIVVRHQTGEKKEITITRDVINIQTIRGFTRGNDQHYDNWLDKDRRIGYVRVTQFQKLTADDLRSTLAALKADGLQALVLDLRFNGGGLLTSAVDMASLFLPEGAPIVSTKGRAVESRTLNATGDPLLPDTPLVILANDSSASASEIVTGALKDNDRALMVGTRTFGKGSVQEIKILDDGAAALKITQAHYFIPSGRNIHRQPDSEVWGVDPSEGCYVAMDFDALREMIDTRREADMVPTNGSELNPQAAAIHNPPTPMTPEWLSETRKDPQLAAAFEAILAKLDTGEWAEVGERNATLLARLTRRNELQRRKEALLEAVGMLDDQLIELDDLSEEDIASDEAEEGLSPRDRFAARIDDFLEDAKRYGYVIEIEPPGGGELEPQGAATDQ